MNIEKFQADLPYPVISGLNPNRKQAMILMKAYSGVYSELSTITQYAYHKVKCMKNKEIAETLQGIFLVETHHLELLGDCINQLGIDPRYYIFLNERSISWQAEVINYKTTMREMILSDIEGEKGAAEFYENTAKIIENEKIAKLLLRLAEDERLHLKILTDLYRRSFR